MNILSPAYPPPTGQFTFRKALDITDFIVHHSAGPLDQTPIEIDAFERTRGDIYGPYTWLIDSTGDVYKMRPFLAISAASYGRNFESVAVCCIGNYMTDIPSQAMLNSLLNLRVYAQSILPALCRTIGHRDIATMFYSSDTAEYATACPGDNLYAKLGWLKTQAAGQFTHG